MKVVECTGIRPDTLGGYLSGLGLLSVASGTWLDARACWAEHSFRLLANGLDRKNLETTLMAWRPQRFERWWAAAQKVDTKGKTTRAILDRRNQVSDSQVEQLDCVLMSTDRNYFNPVLGTGGNIGKRDLGRVQEGGIALIGKATEAVQLGWLANALFAENTVDLPELPGTGTWFVSSNKMFNSGQDWFREGQLSPWSFLFALEGAKLLTGATARMLSGARRYAVFPFVSVAAAPLNRQEAGTRREAEFWAPLWRSPATLSSVRTLLQRGYARIGHRSASGPHEFALAARTAGVDAGITEFARFRLRQTTSSQTFEAIPAERVGVTKPDGATRSLGDLTGWVDKLPRDEGTTGPFYGLRGPVEETLVELLADDSNPERWQDLLLLLARSQTRIDRNRDLRKRSRPIVPLSRELLARAFPGSMPPEVTVAASIASMQSLRLNIYGIKEQTGRQLNFPEARPAHAVWNEIAPLRAMADVLERRLVDAGPTAPVPTNAAWSCPAPIVREFLAGEVRAEDVTRWVPPLSLLDLKGSPPLGKALKQGCLEMRSSIHDFFRPLFHPEFCGKQGTPLANAGTGLQLLKLIRQESWPEAVAVAERRYRANGFWLVHPSEDIVYDGERLAATLLIPMALKEIDKGFQRWLQIERKEKRT